MRVWPGLKLVGAGGKVAKGTFVQVAEFCPERVVLTCGTSTWGPAGPPVPGC